MPGNEPGSSAAKAAAAASKYSVAIEETFILRATAGLYPGELTRWFDGQNLATNPVGMVQAL